LIGLFIFGWPLIGPGNPLSGPVWIAIIQPSFMVQMLLGLALCISSVVGLKATRPNSAGEAADVD
jgi:hypothetical protein